MNDRTADSSDRRFGQADVVRILRLAADLETHPGAVPAPGSDLSLEDIEDVAREAGIAPEAVRAAAARLQDTPEQPRPGVSLLFGAATRFNCEATAPGHIRPAEMGRLPTLMTELLGREGDARVTADALEWVSVDSFGSVRVRIASEQGSTRTLATADRRSQAMQNLVLGFLGGALLVGSGPAISGPYWDLVAVWSVSGGLLGAGAGRWWWRRQSTKWHRRLSKLVQSIGELASSTTPHNRQPQ